MKKVMSAVCMLVISLVLISCSQDLEEKFVGENKEDFSKGEMSFTYKDTKYYSAYEVVDGKTIILEENVREIYELLALNSNLSMVVDTNNNIYYYDNYAEVVEKYDLELQEEPYTKGMKITQYTVEFYENTDLKKHMWTSTTTSVFSENTPKRDKLSSLRFKAIMGGNDYAGTYTTTLTLFDYYDFLGANITFLNYIDNYYSGVGENIFEIPNLKNYPMPGGNWNDAAASYIMGIKRNGAYI